MGDGLVRVLVTVILGDIEKHQRLQSFGQLYKQREMEGKGEMARFGAGGLLKNGKVTLLQLANHHHSQMPHPVRNFSDPLRRQ